MTTSYADSLINKSKGNFHYNERGESMKGLSLNKEIFLLSKEYKQTFIVNIRKARKPIVGSVNRTKNDREERPGDPQYQVIR